MSRVLVVDDDPTMCDLVCEGLRSRGLSCDWRASADEAFELLQTEDFDVVVTDLNMRGMHGLELCERVVANRPDVPIIVLTGFGTFETAIATVRAGASDFLTKPVDEESLALSVERAIQQRSLRREVKRLREEAATPAEQFGDLVGTSAAMKRVCEMIDRVANSDATAFLTGESGTGKELAAHALHTRGRRKAGPFVAINCAAMPEMLLESELFGHVKGAFTDAKGTRRGLFIEASGGTLFLDEIGDMSLGLQAKLLRALEDRKVRPVGGNTEIPFDVRFVTATNKDLEIAVAEHHFREDLYYRINVIHVALPPLRARGGDVLLLAQRFLERFAKHTGKPVAGLSSAVAERLLAYSWPGNVRELQNCIERAVALARFDELTVEDLPERIRNYRGNELLVVANDPADLVTLEEVERRYIRKVLDAVGGSKSTAARVLGLDRTTLYRKLERLEHRR